MSAKPGLMAPEIRRDDPRASDLCLLMTRHAEEMHADTPPESNHMLGADELAASGIDFFVMRVADRPVAMGAVKTLSGDHAEIKSMHVLREYRGQGLARLMLDHLIGHARRKGFRRLSLETGAQPGFAAARALYEGAGFVECPAFAPYRPDPNSVFLTMALHAPGGR